MVWTQSNTPHEQKAGHDSIWWKISTIIFTINLLHSPLPIDSEIKQAVLNSLRATNSWREGLKKLKFLQRPVIFTYHCLTTEYYHCTGMDLVQHSSSREGRSGQPYCRSNKRTSHIGLISNIFSRKTTFLKHNKGKTTTKHHQAWHLPSLPKNIPDKITLGGVQHSSGTVVTQQLPLDPSM